MASDHSELLRTAQKNLVSFLTIELKLANTFCDTARSAKNPEHKTKLLGDVRKAVETIHHFQERIMDPAIRKEAETDRQGGRVLSETFKVAHAEGVQSIRDVLHCTI